MLAAGYNYVEIDAGWPASSRAANGAIQPNATNFPSGMAPVVAHIHGNGELAGIYSNPGSTDCSTNIGSYGHELQDALTFSSWGFDLLKYDWCLAGTQFSAAITTYGNVVAQYLYQYMAQALTQSGRNVQFNVCNYGDNGTNSVTAWWAGGNTHRTTADMGNSWTQIVANLESEVGLETLARPGHFNDPDNLAGPPYVTNTQQQSQMAMWAIVAAPLIAGIDLTSLSSTTKGILLNSDIIAVDQDPLGLQGYRVSSTSCGSSVCEVWAKQLTGTNRCAIALFNQSSTAQSITATFSTIASVVPACGSGPYTTTRDLIAHASLGTLTTSYTASSIASDGVFIFTVAP
jgi:alpha-galactosidase